MPLRIHFILFRCQVLSLPCSMTRSLPILENIRKLVYQTFHSGTDVLNSSHLAGCRLKHSDLSTKPGYQLCLKEQQCTKKITEVSLLITEPYLPALTLGPKHINRYTCTCALVKDFRQPSMCAAIVPSAQVYKHLGSFNVSQTGKKKKREKKKDREQSQTKLSEHLMATSLLLRHELL